MIGCDGPALAAPIAHSVSCPGGKVICEFDGRGKDSSRGHRAPSSGLADIHAENRDLLSSSINHTTTFNAGGAGTRMPMHTQNSASASGRDRDLDQAESHGFERN